MTQSNYCSLYVPVVSLIRVLVFQIISAVIISAAVLIYQIQLQILNLRACNKEYQIFNEITLADIERKKCRANLLLLMWEDNKLPKYSIHNRKEFCPGN